MFKIKLFITILLLQQSYFSFSQSAIGQLENITGQKINRYNTSNSSGYDMNSMISGMVAQSIVNSIFSSNTKNYVPVKEVKVQPTYLVTTISGEQARVEQTLRIEKYKRLMNSYKFLNDSATLKYKPFNEKKEATPEEKKASCMNAQKEINRLTVMKNNFEKQLISMEKLGNDIAGYKNEFEHKRDTAMSGYVDNILDVLPVDVMKKNASILMNEGKTVEQQVNGAKLLAEAEKLDNQLSKTKRLNAAANLLMKNTDKKGMEGKDWEKVVLANENFTSTGVLVEEYSYLGGTKYEEVFKSFGKTLQFQGGLVKTYDDIADGGKFSLDIAGKTAQNLIGIAGQFWPFIRIANAAEQLVEKTAYAAYAEFAAHQMATSVSQNAKAKTYLNDQIKQLNERINNYESVVNEYKKINPAGCPVVQ